MVGQALGLNNRTGTAWAITVAAIALIANTSALTDEALPVNKVKIASPSDIVCTGLMLRAKRPWATRAILVISALLNGTLVATAPMVVLLPVEVTAW